MVYKVVISRLAQSQLSRYIGYIKRQLGNSQAAQAVLLDARETKKRCCKQRKACPSAGILIYRPWAIV
jgi:plasmid stabilization system protein ParE